MDEKKADENKHEVKVDEKKSEVKADDVVDLKVEPKKVEVDDPNKKFTIDEVNKLLQDATQSGVQIAKQQLYPEIERLKGKLKENTENLKKIKKITPETEAEKKALAEEKERLAKELTASKTQLTDANSKLKTVEDTALDAINQVNILKDDLAKKEVESYKLQKIAESGGEIIPEMVVGSTIEEIDKSVVKAKEKYLNVLESVRKDLNLPKVPPKEKVEGGSPEEKPEIKRLAKQSDFSDWKGSREDLRKKLYSSYGFPT